MRRSIQIVLIFLAVFLGTFLNNSLAYSGKIAPGITVAGIDVGGLTLKDAGDLLTQKIDAPEKMTLVSDNQTFEIATASIDLSYDLLESVQRAFNLTRTGNIFFDFRQRFNLLIEQKNIGLSVKLNEEELSKAVSVISGQFFVEPVYPSAKIEGNKILLTIGQKGMEVDSLLLRARIGQSLSLAGNESIEIPISEIGQTLTADEAEAFKSRAEKYVSKSLTLTFEDYTFKLDAPDILMLLNAYGGFNEEGVGQQRFKVAKEINRGPQDPKFAFEGGRVTEFLPARDGIELDNEKFKIVLTENLNSLADSSDQSKTAEIPVVRTPPQVTTDKVNDLGIKELIGRGISRFRGSIPSRVHNIELASGRLNGILIKPGETFSFNEALGDVSKFTGYQEAYVIREGKTVLGDGGGVCQVSTTFFRATLNAGLPVLERQAHAYRVGYYEQGSPPGLDATVYGPAPDLKIKNDTPAHVLIQAKVDRKNSILTFEFYGTSDGRIATTSKPAVTNVTSPGEDLYIDDPTLAAGTVKQTEHRANGAKVTFNYLVERNGETIYKKTFISNYRPWQAVYLRGTAPTQ